MPIEREMKYVLRHDATLENRLMSMVEQQKLSVIDIKQGYFSERGRVRGKEWRYRLGEKLSFIDVDFVFTYKLPLTNKPGSLESETTISTDDFHLAWEETTNRITKTRYVLNCADNGVWEIDFFKNGSHTYLVMAEFEIPDGEDVPTDLHPFVKEHLLYAVAENDNRFKNKKLCDPSEVEELLKEIVK